MHPERPVIAHHLILTCYGFWLPNDPRGSGSQAVWSDALKPFGPANPVTTRHSVAGVAHDRSLRLSAKKALSHPPVRLTGSQALTVARGVGRYVRTHGLQCEAFAVMPDHAHVVFRQMPCSINRVATALKAASVHALLMAGQHPFQNADEGKRPKVWARGERIVYLFDEAAVHRSVGYVEDNPIRSGFKRQRWWFVKST